MTLYELFVKISADTADYDKKITAASAKIQRFGDEMSKIGSRLTFAITAPLLGAGAAALKVAGDIEQANIAFETMLGSGQKAKQFLDELKAFALKTPFNFLDLTDASKRLLALGFTAKEIIPTLEAVGAAAAALGKGKEGIDRITLAFGQMLAKGTVQAEEMRQLAEAGIPAWDILAKKLGVDIPTAMKMVEARTVESRLAIDALTENMRTRFGPAFDKFAGSWAGMWEKMKESAMFAAADIGNILMPFAKSLVNDTIMPILNGAKDLAAWFARLSPEAQKLAVALGFVAVAGPPVVWALGALVSNSAILFSAFVKLSGGISALCTSFTAAFIPAITGAAYAVWNNLIPAMNAAETRVLAITAKIGLLVAAYVAFRQAMGVFDEARGLFDRFGSSAENNLQRVTYALGSGNDPQGKAVRGALKWATQGVNDFAEAWKSVKWTDFMGPLGALRQVLANIAAVIEFATGKYKSMEDAQRAVVANLSKIPAAPLTTSTGAVGAGSPPPRATSPEWTKEAQDAYNRSKLAFDERSAQANLLARNVEEAWKWQQMLSSEFEAFGADVPAVTANIENLKDVWEPTFKQAPTQVEEIAAAFKTLGITSADEYQRIADASKAAYDTIERSGIGTMEEVTRAFLKSERDQIRAAEAKGLAVSDSWKKMLDEIEADLDKTTSTSVKTTQRVESGWKKLGQQVSTVLTDLSRDLADLVFQGGKFKDVMVNAAESFGKAILRAAIESQLKRILGLFRDLIVEGGTLGKVLGTVFGSGSSTASSAASTAGSAAGGAASSAGSSAGSVASSALSGISAATGVFSIFQNMRQETSLNAIEWNTRKSSLHLEALLTEALKHWPGLDGLNSYNWDVQAKYLQMICAGVESIDAKGASSGGTYTINISGAGDPKAVAQEVIRALKLQSTVAAYA